MTKISARWPAAVLMAGALAMPASAFAQHRQFGGNGGGHGNSARSSAGFAHSGGGFASRPATHSFAPHFNRQSTHFGTVHRGRTVSRSVKHSHRLRSVRRTQPQHRIAQPKIVVHTPRNASARHTVRHALRHNETAGITPQAARHGRFASRFGERTGHHFANVAAHRAWRRGWRAGFVAWYGPLFWPYAYSDIIDYAFWPYGYDDGFWFYVYDDFFDGMFWGEVGPPEEYAYAAPAAPRASRAGVEELCTQPGTGITAWPFKRIESKVGLNAEQKQLLGDVRTAAADAAATFKASCPPKNAFPLTPPGRLQAMTARLQGTLDAVRIVRPALDKFYASLNDEQKERFNQLGPKTTAKVASNAAETTGASAPDANSCKQPKPGLANLPIERIEDVVKPTDAQQDALKQLQDATTKAVSVLQAACPEDVPLTPPGRLQAMEKRLQAMIDAANTVKPALDGFYASLSNEQKARFDRLGRELAKSGG
jgi:LTXXQ motif family protein